MTRSFSIAAVLVTAAISLAAAPVQTGKVKPTQLAQAEQITRNMASAGVKIEMKDKQIVALVAYLQRLGKKIEDAPDVKILGDEKSKKEADRDAANVE